MLTLLFHQELPKGKWFCCIECNKIHSALENLVVEGEQTLPDSLLNAIRMKHEEKGSDSGANFDIRWRVLNWKLVSSDETRQLLSKAVSIFHVSNNVFLYIYIYIFVIFHYLKKFVRFYYCTHLVDQIVTSFVVWGTTHANSYIILMHWSCLICF